MPKERERESKIVRERKRVKKRLKQNYNFSKTRLSSLPGIVTAATNVIVKFEVIFVAAVVVVLAVADDVVVVVGVIVGVGVAVILDVIVVELVFLRCLCKV